MADRECCCGAARAGQRSQIIRVLVVAGVRLYRDGLADLLRRDSRLEVVANAASQEEAVAAAERMQPDVAVLDLGVAGPMATRALKATAPGLRVVALAIGEANGDVVEWAEAGAAGFVPPDCTVDDLTDAIVRAAVGEVACTPDMAASLVRRVREVAALSLDVPVLTARETEIARLIESGLSNKEIAQRLHIEVATVKNHVHRILEKLGVARRAEAATILRRGGLVPTN